MSSYKIKEDGMGRACCMHGIDEKYTQFVRKP